MSLEVTLYRNRLALLALLCMGALFMLVTYLPASKKPQIDKLKPMNYDYDDIRWMPNGQRRRQRPTSKPSPPQAPARRPTPSSSVKQAAPTQQTNVEKDTVVRAEQKAVEEKIYQLIKRNRVMVFSKTYCPYSREAKSLLSQYQKDHGLAFDVLEADLEANPLEVKAALGKISSRFTFPNIFVDGQSIGGGDELRQLHANGELIALFKEKNLLA
ncbi:hypothetical protein EV183_001135 [Coemansia sp. RSA 2336]|nr:hypothetical protein EV183_001135 [Coemansia sp. RSA 2336]